MDWWPLVIAVVRQDEMMTMTKTIIIGISGLGTLMFILGQIITFVPGAETDWFLTTAALLAFGAFSRVRIWRITVVVLTILALGAAFMGHKRGIEYKEWLSRQPHATTNNDNGQPNQAMHQRPVLAP